MPAPVQTSAGRYTGNVPTYYVAGPQGEDWGAAWWSGYYGSIDPYARALFAAKLKAADPSERAAAKAALLAQQVRLFEDLSGREADAEKLHIESADRAAALTSAEKRTERTATATENAANAAASARVTGDKIKYQGKVMALPVLRTPGAKADAEGIARGLSVLAGQAEQAYAKGDTQGVIAAEAAIAATLSSASVALTKYGETDAAKGATMDTLLSIPASVVRQDGTPLFPAENQASWREGIAQWGTPSKGIAMPEVEQYSGGVAHGKPIELTTDAGQDVTVDTSTSTSRGGSGSASGPSAETRSYAEQLRQSIDDQLKATERDFETAAHAAPLTIPKYDELLDEDNSTLPADDEALSEEEARKRRQQQ